MRTCDSQGSVALLFILHCVKQWKILFPGIPKSADGCEKNCNSVGAQGELYFPRHGAQQNRGHGSGGLCVCVCVVSKGEPQGREKSIRVENAQESGRRGVCGRERGGRKEFALGPLPGKGERLTL